MYCNLDGNPSDEYLYNIDLSDETLQILSGNPGCAGAQLSNNILTDSQEPDPLPSKIPFISLEPWMHSISFFENNTAFLKEICRSNKTYDLNFARYLMGAFIKKFATGKEISSIHNTPDNATITFSVPAFIRAKGVKCNHGNDSYHAITNKLHSFDNVRGVMAQENGWREYEIIQNIQYNPTNQTVTLASPYFMRIIKCVEQARLKLDNRGNPVIRKDGTPSRRAGYSYRLYPRILQEQCIRAAEMAGIIATLLDRSPAVRKGRDAQYPHIRVRTLLQRCLNLSDAIENASASRKNAILKSTFEGAWKMLSSELYTDIHTRYEKLQLPRIVPTGKKLDEVLTFKYESKICHKQN